MPSPALLNVRVSLVLIVQVRSRRARCRHFFKGNALERQPVCNAMPVAMLIKPLARIAGEKGPSPKGLLGDGLHLGLP
jgi:hypothetical protein